MTLISDKAFHNAVQNGTIDKLQDFILSMMKQHTDLTINEAIKIITDTPGLTPEAIAKHSRAIVNMLPSLDTAGRLRKRVRPCLVTEDTASAYFENPDWTPDNEKYYRYDRAQEVVNNSVHTLNKWAAEVNKPGVVVLPDNLKSEFKDLIFALEHDGFDSNTAIVDRIKDIVGGI